MDDPKVLEPPGMVRSSVSISVTNPTPRCSSRTMVAVSRRSNVRRERARRCAGRAFSLRRRERCAEHAQGGRRDSRARAAANGNAIPPFVFAARHLLTTNSMC